MGHCTAIFDQGKLLKMQHFNIEVIFVIILNCFKDFVGLAPVRQDNNNDGPSVAGQGGPFFTFKKF